MAGQWALNPRMEVRIFHPELNNDMANHCQAMVRENSLISVT